MVRVSKAKWDKIPKDYKGRWDNPREESYIGKRTVLSGCIGEKPGSLLIERIHFEVVAEGN